MMDIVQGIGDILNHTSVNHLVYADDIVILGNDTNTVENLSIKPMNNAKKVDLHIIAEKT